jgi:hypothetical protein
MHRRNGWNRVNNHKPEKNDNKEVRCVFARSRQGGATRVCICHRKSAPAHPRRRMVSTWNVACGEKPKPLIHDLHFGNIGTESIGAPRPRGNVVRTAFPYDPPLIAGLVFPSALRGAFRRHGGPIHPAVQARGGISPNLPVANSPSGCY